MAGTNAMEVAEEAEPCLPVAKLSEEMPAAGIERDKSSMYSPEMLSDEVVRMETGLPDLAMFRRVVGLVQHSQGSINYAGLD